MKRLAVITALIAAPAAAHHVPEHLLASAITPCMGLADSLDGLFKGGYLPMAGGVMPDGAEVKVWVRNGGEFVVIYTLGNDACLIQRGTKWRMLGEST